MSKKQRRVYRTAGLVQFSLDGKLSGIAARKRKRKWSGSEQSRKAGKKRNCRASEISLGQNLRPWTEVIEVVEADARDFYVFVGPKQESSLRVYLRRLQTFIRRRKRPDRFLLLVRHESDVRRYLILCCDFSMVLALLRTEPLVNPPDRYWLLKFGWHEKRLVGSSGMEVALSILHPPGPE